MNVPISSILALLYWLITVIVPCFSPALSTLFTQSVPPEEPWPCKPAQKGSLLQLQRSFWPLLVCQAWLGFVWAMIISLPRRIWEWGAEEEGKFEEQRNKIKERGNMKSKVRRQTNAWVGPRRIRWWRENYDTSRALASFCGHWNVPLSSFAAKGQSFGHIKPQLPHLSNGSNESHLTSPRLSSPHLTSAHCVLVLVTTAMIHDKQIRTGSSTKRAVTTMIIKWYYSFFLIIF